MRFCSVLLVVVALAGPAFSLDREAFTFTKYDLQVRIEPEQQRIGVRGAITLRNDSQTPQKNAALQISSSLTWRSIQIEGKPVQFVSQPYESDIDHTGELSEAIIALPKEIAPGGSVELTIGYEGVIAPDANRLIRIGLPKEQAIHSDWDQIGKSFTGVRGIGNVVWYPVASESANLSDGNSLFEALGRWRAKSASSTMQVGLCAQVPATEVRQWVLLMNNIERGDVGGGGIGGVDHDPSVDKCGAYAFQPLGQLVPTFAVAPYEPIATEDIVIYFLPAQKSQAQAFAQAAEKVKGFVAEWVGPPRSQGRVVQLADAGSSPYEAGTMLLTPLSDTDPKLLQIVMAHELAHAGFPSNRAWIYEGLAHFAQAAFRERQENRAAALDLLGLHRAALLAAENLTDDQQKQSSSSKPSVREGESLISTSIEEYSRSKSAYVWWMLRDMLGAEALKKALASYRPEQDLAPEYMPRLLQAQSQRDLQWFFDDWVYHDRGLPDFRIESAFSRQTSEGNYLLTVTVENLATAGAEVPVTAHFEGGELSQRVEVRGKSKAVVRISTPKPAAEVIVNDGSVPETDMSNNVFRVQTSK